MCDTSWCGNVLKVLTTTLHRKLSKGTRLMPEPNGKNVRIIRKSAGLLAKPVMIGHAGVSTTERMWVDYDSLINLSRLKIQSSPIRENDTG